MSAFMALNGHGNGSAAHKTAAVRRQTRMHRLIEEEGIIVLPGVYDGVSAATVQKCGFSAGFISGYAVSASRIGKPDIGLLTPPEMADATRVICSTASIPFIADADTGGGSAINIQRTIKDLIAAGAAGCFLEDQAWPKKCGHIRGKQVIPAEEHAAKIAAARYAIGDADFFLIARTDARGTSDKHGLAEAIYRANLYYEAGADACFIEAPRSDEELREIARKTKGYRICNLIEGGKTPLRSTDELKEMGFHIIIYSLTALYASARGMRDVLNALKQNGTTRDQLHKLVGFEEFHDLIGLESWLDLESHFSTATFKSSNGSAKLLEQEKEKEQKQETLVA